LLKKLKIPETPRYVVVNQEVAKRGLLVGKIESWEYLGANFREMGIFARIQYSVFSYSASFFRKFGIQNTVSSVESFVF